MSENRGNLLIAPIAPRDINDTFPTHLEQYGEGGYRTVDTILQRDSISLYRQKVGMLVNVIEERKIFKLVLVAEQLTDDCWEELKTGGSGGGITAVRLHEIIIQPKTIFPIRYTVGHVDVFVNGVKIYPEGFTALDKRTVVLDSNLVADASEENPLEVEILAGWAQGADLVFFHKIVQSKDDLLYLNEEIDEDGNVIERGVIVGDKIYVIEESTTYVCTSLSDPLDFENYEIDNIKGAIDIAGCIPGEVPEEQTLFLFVSGRKMAIPENMSGSLFRSLVAPSSDYIISLRKNGEEIGSIIFPAGEISAVCYSDEINLLKGDLLTIVSPVTSHGISDIAFYILGIFK